ncbi:PIN/TRAM domain-containing protein [Paenibacillus sabuli]|uniref:PIN/TRAM domain-containing protein n=1 Tax=Paenibacillus sabuli TaxID=2772509 RepID=UPI00295C1891|nr:PIN/TRAM domain-containing protein [Paenibacillus sabuli]
MEKKWIQVLGLIAGGWVGAEFSAALRPTVSWMESSQPFFQQSGAYYSGIALGAVGGLAAATALAGPLTRQLRRVAERAAAQPTADLISGGLGLLCGLAIAALLVPAAGGLGGGIGALLWAVLTLLCGYMGLRIGLLKKDELAAGYAAYVKAHVAPAPAEEERWFEEHKILDTSVIIDGRIADICKTGFIEGTLVIPEFVLEELQHIADSSDLLKRNRGRRGLDILNKIQKELDVRVLIYEGDFEEIGEVDSKLVKLAKALQGKVVTNDFNLNKVCELQGVSVLNINDLANAVKPVVLPGEEIVVQVIKDGKEHGQGVAYLDDGTMIVVEGGRDYIGTMMEVLVTSVLQTSAGRMIFAKPKLLEKAQ